jgi:uncharacterized repeat protein (TIGR01451 family)
MQDDTRLFRPTRAALATLLVFQALCTGLPAAPALTATKDDGVGALVKKPAGSTVTYTNTISNATGAGITDATGVQFADPDVANTTYVPNTLTATPVAVDDVYPTTVIANTSINTANSGFSVVTNDFAGYSAGTAVLASALTITNVVTPAHGALVMTLSGAGVGQFVYTPTAGYVGGDSFTYTISNSVAGGTAASRTATVNLTVGGPVIWFVNPALGINGTGILGNPFNNLASAAAAIGANINQRVFIFSGGSAQTTGITLNSGGWLVGQAAVGASFEALMGGISYPADTTTARPTINNGSKPGLTRSGGHTVTLGENSIILGLAIGNTGGGYAISGSGINVVQIGNAVSSDVDLTSGVDPISFTISSGALSLTGGNGGITVNAPIATTAGHSVNIVNRTGGTLAFPKVVGDSGTGINLTGNTGATVNFTGGLSLSTGTSTAFNATGGGTITATQNNSSIVNTLATTFGAALNVANTTIGASGITFRSISAGTGAGSAGVGISLNTTGSSGALTVTGNGTAGSGGTIQHKTGSDLSTTAGIGIYLNNTSNVSLARMQLNDFDNFAIRGTSVSGFTLSNSVINSAGGSSWNGTNDAGGVNEGSVSFSELTGSALISNTSISGGYADNVRVVNTTGTLNRITFDTVTIGANHSGAALDGSQDHGNDGISLEALTGSAVLNATVQNSTFTSSRGDVFQFANNGLAANDLIFTGNHLSNNYPRIATGGGGVSLFSNGTGNLTLSLTNNDFRDSVGAAVLIVKSTGTATLAGTISNNTIGVAGVSNSGSLEGSALKIQSTGGGTVTTLITNNFIRQYNNNGIELLTGGGASAQGGNFNSTITGNTLTNPGNNPSTAAIAKNGIQLNGGTFVGDTYLISLDIGGAGALANSLSGAGAASDIPAGGEDIRLRQRQDTRVQLRGYAGAPNDNAAVQAYAIGRNGGDGAPSAIASNQASTGTDGFYNTPGGGPVTQPLIFATGGIEKSADPVIAPPVSLEVGAVTDFPAIQPVAVETKLSTPAGPEVITQQQLDTAVAAAVSRWEASGLTGEQLAVLRGMAFEVSTLGDNHLGEASAKLIRVDGNAGGNGWFVDVSGASDALFGNVKSDTRRYTDRTGLPAGRLDLLTTIMHEMGHALGLPDSYSSKDRESIMFGQLTKGERRTPTKNQASGAKPFAGDSSHFLSGGLNPITIGILPPGKSVVITYDVLIDNPFTLGATQLTSQGTVHSTTASFADTLTDDPNAGGASDPTVTLLDRPDTTVASIALASSSPTSANPVSWTVTFADAISSLSGSNFLLVSSGLGGAPAISSVTPTGGVPATVWTVTASAGSGSGTLGLNMANDTALSHDVTNQPLVGQIYTIDRTPPDASIALSDTALAIGETSLVTITFTEAVTGFTNADITSPNGTLGAVSSGDGGITWTATFTPTAGVSDATNVITLDKTGVIDAAGNAGVGSAVSPNYAVDTARPTASIVVADNALKAGETSLVTFTFNEAVTGFTNADLTVANGTLAAVTSGDGGITWTATLTPTAGLTDFTNLITLDNTGVADASGNAGTGTTDSNNYAIDTVRPTATLVVADTALAAGETSLVTVTFSEAVTAFTTADLTVANGTVSGLSTPDGGITWSVTLTPTAGVTDPTNLVTLDNTGVTDLSGNTGTGTTDSNNYAIDTLRPTASIVVADIALRAGETSLVTITFSEAVTGFTNADLAIANGTLTSVSSGDGGVTWTATLTPTASVTDATNLITLANTGVQDAAGNTGIGTTDSNNYAIDTARPTATLVVADNNLTIGETSLVTITFSEAVTGFANADLAIENGTLSAVSSGDGGVTWTATLTPTPNVTDATNVITLDNTGVQDAAGNTGTGTTDSNNYAVTSLSISIAANGASTAEGTGAGTTAFTFTVSRTGSTVGAVTMNYAVSGAAVDAADFGGTLPSGVFTIPDTQASAVLTINVSQDSTVEPDELFTVTLSSPGGGYAITTATASSTITNDDFAADLAITVTDGVTTATPGGSVTYTITASNAGPHPATSATLVDTFPAALTATWTAVGAGGATAPPAGSGNINAPVNLPVGGSVTFTVSATISPAATGTLSNTASISSSVADPVPGNNSATDTDTLAPQADLAITKTDGVTTATPGGSVTYTITASNAGPSNATGVTVADTFPASIPGATWSGVGAGGGSGPASGSGNINASTVNLPAGGSFTFTVTAPVAASAIGTLSNTATVTVPAGVTDPTPGNNSATDTDTLTPSADVSVTVTDSPDPVIAGNNLTYTVTVANNGPSAAASVTLTDTLPAGTTFVSLTSPGGWSSTTPAVGGTGTVTSTLASLAPGSASFTLVVNVGGGVASGTVVSDTATVSSATTDPTPGNNSGTATTTVSAQADLAITKTDGVTTSTPGTSVTYTITASNAGPSTVTGATVADTLPASISGATWIGVGAGGGSGPASGSGNINASTVNLPAGGSFTFTVIAPIAASATGTLSNTATVTAPAGVTDPTPGNNSATDTDTLTASADVSVVLTDSPDPVIAGNNLTYTVTVANNGPSSAASVTLTDTLPAGTTFVSLTSPGGWSSTTPAVGGTGTVTSTLASLAPGPSVFTLVVNVGNAVAPGTVLSDTATVSSATTDPTPANNSSTATTTVNAQADLAVTVTDSPDPVIAGNNLTYTITVANNGPSSATSVVLNAPLPPGTTFVSLTSPGGWSSIAVPVGQAGLVTSTIANFAPGSVNFTLVVKVDSALAAGTVLNDTVAIGTATTDPTPGNNSATTTTAVTAQADLAVTITDSPDPVNAGGNLTYTIVLSNNGPSTAVSPSVSLPLPAGTTFVSRSAPIFWSATQPAVGGTGTVSFTNLSLASGGTATFTVVAKVDLTVVNNSTLTATATAASATTDPTPGNNLATTTTLAKSGADLQIALADSPDPVIAGTNLTYTLQVANNGPLDADNVSITDTLPAGTTFVSLTAPSGWTTTTPAVGAAGSVTITKLLFANSGNASFTLVVKVGSAVANGTVLSDTAAVTSTTLDIIPGNNSATTTSTVTTQADLAIQITGTPATAPKGSNVTYVMTLTNNGASDASAPNASLAIPGRMTFVSATAPGGWSTTAPAVGSNGTVVFAKSSLATSATVSFTVVARVKSSAPSGSILTAIATASSTATDPAPANNSASAIGAVGTVNATAVQPVTTGIGATSQTGLFDVIVNVTNTTPVPINGFRLHVNFNAYKAAFPSLRLYNASSAPGAADVYVDFPYPVAVDEVVAMKLSFYTSTRTFPSPFAPVLTVETLATSQVSDSNGQGVQPRLVRLADKTVLLEFPSVAGKWYRVRYSPDMVNWFDCPVPLQAGNSKMQWIDSGPPFTNVSPASAPSRFYIVNEIAAP